MSLITKYSRISVKPFAAVPALGDLPEIQRPSATVSNLSSARGIGEGVDLAEGCILTKSIKFTHQLAHWVNAVRGGDARAVVSRYLTWGYLHVLRLVSIPGGYHRVGVVCHSI